MLANPATPWHPDRRWADPLLALLTLLALLAAGLALLARQRAGQRPPERASLQGRLAEVALAGPGLLTGRQGNSREWTRAQAQLKEPWDRALLAVLKAELAHPPGEPAAWIDPATPAGPSGQLFRRACLAAYAGAPVPPRGDREEVHRRLGHGFAAALLEARILDREGRGEALRAEARGALLLRLVGLGSLGLLALGLAAGGLAVGLYLLTAGAKTVPPALPEWEMSGRAAAFVFLGWFLAFFLAGSLAGALLRPWPGLRWAALPLGYAFHVAVGLFLICSAEGLSFSALWRRVAPGRGGRDLAWGIAFLALAVGLVLVVALLVGLILKPDQSPQRELQDWLRGLVGWAPNLVVFLTVAGLAPFFEELLFRGFLLPILARRQPLALALTLSALLFGAIHLQPTGLPVLGTLGFVLGLAMRQTGSLRSPLLVHACWNGSLFLLLRTFA